MEQTPRLPVLDARVVAWQHSLRSAECALDVRPSQEVYGSSAPVPVTCANVGLNVRVSSDDLHAASVKLGEFLRLLHAATAHPLRYPSYDWLQQLVWPTVCTLPQCRCCRDGDRRVTLKLSCATNQSVPLPQVIYGSLFDWVEDEASAEYKELISAIQQDAEGAAPEEPLKLVVEVLSHSSQVTNTTEYLASVISLLRDLAEKTSDWFHVDLVSASFVSVDFTSEVYKQVLNMLTTSNLRLALPAFSPTTKPCDTSVNEWLFHQRVPRNTLPLPMPAIVDLRLLFAGAPSARVFTEFCAWLATNDSLEVLAIQIPTQMDSPPPEVWESFGFALFSPLSKLKLRRLELDIRGITDGMIAGMVLGSQRPRVDSQRSEQVDPSRHTSHGMLKLTSSALSTALLIEFIRHFGYVARGFEVSVDGRLQRLVLQAILESTPALEELNMVLLHPTRNDLTNLEDHITVFTGPTPKLRALTLFDMSDNITPDTMAQTLAVAGHSLTYLSIYGSTASETIANTILTSCPVLETLAVASVDASFWERLRDGYSAGVCKISHLSVGERTRVPSPWMLDLVETLQDPASPFTRTLQKLQHDGYYNSSELAVLQRALLEMLDKNPFLVQLELSFCFQQQEAARAKNGEIVANVSYPLHPRQRSAVLSCSPQIANGMVPRDIWRLILDYSARPARRSVVMRM